MYIALLSGGSGKRLWPLSNELRSKQYIKLINSEYSDKTCSMVQRVWEQLSYNGLDKNSVITASAGQVEIIKSQLGNINIAVEPDRRDTFPAVVLSCAYVKDRMHASDDDVIAILPVDPYTESKYFSVVKSLEQNLLKSGADIAIMGVVPTEPSTKFGYVITEEKAQGAGYSRVRTFKEKPDYDTAEKLVQMGAYWNCGVFCFRIGFILKLAEKYGVQPSYDYIYSHYSELPAISFDYEVMEKTSNIILVEFDGMWEDLGTWNALSERMHSDTFGNVISDGDSVNTTVINELNIPVVTIGLDDLIVVSTFDGILISRKDKSHKIKDLLKNVNLPCMYEERMWGTIKTMDISETADGFTLFRKIMMFADKSSSYHYHNERDETLTILSGRGEMIIEGVKISLSQGSTLTVPRGKRHAIKAFSDLEYMEIHMGKRIGDNDINRITFDWNEALLIN